MSKQMFWKKKYSNYNIKWTPQMHASMSSNNEIQSWRQQISKVHLHVKCTLLQISAYLSIFTLWLLLQFHTFKLFIIFR